MQGLTPNVDSSEEVQGILSGGSRVIVISRADVDLRPPAPDNTLVLLRMAEGSLAAGGRGGGFGERRVVEVSIFESRGGVWARRFRTDEEARLPEFEVPYHVSRLPMTLADGTETMGYGVVDPDLVGEMLARAGPSSA